MSHGIVHSDMDEAAVLPLDARNWDSDRMHDAYLQRRIMMIVRACYPKLFGMV